MIVDVEYMRAVIVRWRITAPQVERVAAVVEQAQGALFVKRSRESVGNADLNPWLSLFSTWACNAL